MTVRPPRPRRLDPHNFPHRTTTKGVKVNAEQPVKTQSGRTGAFATLRAFLSGQGSGTPSHHDDRTGAPSLSQISRRPESARGQAAQGRREDDNRSAHPCVTRRRPTEDTGMRRARRTLSAAAGVVALFLGVGAFLTAATAQAATPEAHWTIDSFAYPADFSAADNAGCRSGVQLAEKAMFCDTYKLTATDSGAKSIANGSAVTIEDALPPGVVANTVGLYWSGIGEGPIGIAGEGVSNEVTNHFCTITPLKCTIPAEFFSSEGHTVAPDDTIRMEVSVTVTEPAVPGTLSNSGTIEGGGVPRAQTTAQNTLERGATPFGPTAFTAPALGLGGTPETQAAGHPYELPTKIDLASKFGETPEGLTNHSSVQDPRDILVDLPLGLAGSALSAPTCTLAQLSSGEQSLPSGACPPESVVGHIRTSPEGFPSARSNIYNIAPEHGVAAEFVFMDLLHNPHVLYASLVPTPAGYVLRTTASEIPAISLTDITANIYGDPAARDGSGVEPKSQVPTFTSPAACNGQPLVTKVHMDSWQHPGTYNPDGSPNLAEPNWVTATSTAPPVTGCNKLAGLFKPTITATPTTDQGDSPTGLEVDLKLPQQSGAETLAIPPLKKAVVTLPEGMTVNPSSANGLEGCSLAALGMSASGEPDAAPPHCPDASKIGELELETPALPGVLGGQIYVAKQTENPFGSLLALYLVVDDPKTGVVVKIPGEIKADPTTGQLQTVIDNSPQFPFSELRTKFFAGQKAALRTPSVCGTYKVTSNLTPWSAPESGPPATPAGTFKITQGCAESADTEPNKPAFSAGTITPVAGAYSPFVLKLAREDGSQEFKGLNVALPPGLIGKLAGVQECPEADIAAARAREHEGGGVQEQTSPSCPASSEVGTVTVGAGAGLTPYYATGHAYLAGPYKGAPLSLAIITPAVAGPYDLGTVVVRNALEVNPETTQITAVSDEIPHILGGIPLDIRSIALSMNRPNFTLNPTSCEKKSITGTATSVLGQAAPLTNPFQVGGCKALGFHPNLALSLKGGTKRHTFPALKAVLTYPKGNYANIAKTQVTLPHSSFLEQGHIKTVCTRPQLASQTCPAASVYGKATAVTPLLDKPLSGPVYLGVGFGNKLPDLVAELNGQIRVLLDGKVDTGVGDGLRNTFEVIPDAPVSKFTLELYGGKKSLVVNSENLCSPNAKTKAIVDFTGQNGKVYDTTPTVANSCGGGKAKKGGKGKKHGKAHKSQASRAILGRLRGGW
jgi:hypothetical protein